MKQIMFIACVMLLIPIAALASSIDAPHNETNNIACGDCHNYSLWWQFSPVDSDPDIRAHRADSLCLRCHDGSNPEIVSVLNHSSASLGLMHRPALGEFSNSCVDCHDPHFQAQLNWYSTVPNSEIFLVMANMSGPLSFSGDGSSASPYSTTFEYQNVIINSSGWEKEITPWDAKNGKQGRGLLLVLTVSEPGNTYEVTSVNQDTNEITVNGKIDPAFDGSEVQFGLIYGQLIRDNVKVDSGTREVRFFDNKGGFADIDTYDGICQVCHTKTRNFRNAGGINFDDYIFDHTGRESENCISCHLHSNGMAHAGGSGNAESCQECHGHDVGYDGLTGGHGTFSTHSTHTENDIDDARGPNIDCDGCHNSANMPNFKDGVTYNDYKSGIATTVCNGCHSSQGSYDGVNDSEIGAIANWPNGVYEADGSLKSGKEKWCATCHDEVPSVIGGVSAPNVIGGENSPYTYGVGWGYYKTGHGLAATETYPSKGGIETLAGRPIECNACHDLTAAHIDGNARTFDCGVNQTECDPAEYSSSYRLKMIDGLEPMEIPKIGSSITNPNNADQFRLCAQCHPSEPLTDGTNVNTNFADWQDGVFINRHTSHLGMFFQLWPADWDFSEYADTDGDGILELVAGSRPTCMTCHNVHGSTRLAMVRDGKLIGREPGLQIWYGNKDLGTFTFSAQEPVPANIPLSASTGNIWRGSSVTNVCTGCHGPLLMGDFRCVEGDIGYPECSQPFQSANRQPPILKWTGENGYESDGVNPQIAGAGSIFSFRIKYMDINNDAPTTIQLWIDKDDDGVYENDDADPDSDETIDMIELDSRDVNYWEDGKIYTITIPLYKSGDNTFTYQFHAVGGGDTIKLPLEGDLTVSVANNRPVLSWTKEAYFETGGVYPNVGGLGGNYEFSITYTDADGECPANNDGIQVWIDENDNGYEAGEKHNLLEDSGGDNDCADGKIYKLTRALNATGSHNYRFYATDGLDAATASIGPLSDNTVTVNQIANTPPLLEWYGGTCVTKGVKPALGAAGEEFEFAMNYSDPDGCPSDGVFQVWLDLNGDGYSADEQHDMLEADPADTDCTDGKVFRYTTPISPAGNYNYRFYANDGSADGRGEAITENQVEVIDAVAVHQGESIQAAISHDLTILVYEGNYTENISYTSGGVNNSNVTLQSVCGPEVTRIQASEGTNSAVSVVGVSNPVIDGFTISGGINEGIYLNGGLTVKNCIVENNGRGITSITISSRLTVEDTIIRNNTTALSGAAIYFNSGGLHSISRSVISDNHSTGGSGGGIFLQNSGLGLTIDNTLIKNNTASAMGAGIYATRSKVDTNKVTISSNTSGGDGGGLYLKEDSNATMVNSNIVDNTAGSYGGGVYLGNYNSAIGNLNMTNCTISNNKLTNTVSGIGGGVYNRLSNVSINNSIFWGNKAAGLGSAHEAYAWLGATNTFTFSNSEVMNNVNNFKTKDGTIVFDSSCIDADPLFVNSSNGDYHLQSNSPAIDQGTSDGAPVDDIDGDARPPEAGYDMGSDEYVP